MNRILAMGQNFRSTRLGSGNDDVNDKDHNVKKIKQFIMFDLRFSSFFFIFIFFCLFVSQIPTTTNKKKQDKQWCQNQPESFDYDKWLWIEMLFEQKKWNEKKEKKKKLLTIVVLSGEIKKIRW